MATIDDINGLIDQLPDPPTPAPQADPNTFGGRLAMGVRDVLQGAAQGLPGQLYNAAGSVLNLPARAIGALTGADVSPYLIQPAATNVDRALDALGLPQEGTPNAVGRIIRGTSAGLSSVPVGGLLSAAAPGTIAGTVGDVLAGAPVAQAAGGAAGAGSSLATDPLRATNPTLASFIDAASSLAAAGSTLGLSNLLNAPNLPADIAEWAAKARDTYGIPVTGGDITRSPFVRTMASVNRNLPFSGAAAGDAAINDAWTRGVSRTIGQDTSRITKSTMADARADLGDEFDRIGRVSDVTADDGLIGDLARIHSEAPLALTTPELQPVHNQIDNLQNLFAANDGTVPGSVFQNLTNKNAPLSKLANNDNSNIASYGSQIEDALFDAWERQAPPDEVANLQNARLQYKNLKTIEPLVEKSPTGELNPRLLPGQMQRNWDDLAYQGGGQLGDLADIGTLFLRPPPDSGTALRSFITGLIAHPAGVATAGLLPLTNRALGAGLRSDWLTNRMLSSSLGAPSVSVPPTLGAGLSAYTLGQQQQQPGAYDDLRSLLR